MNPESLIYSSYGEPTHNGAEADKSDDSELHFEVCVVLKALGEILRMRLQTKPLLYILKHRFVGCRIARILQVAFTS